ncbi:putative transposase OrfB [Piscirickettsia salmonis]|uniref:Integrase n=3 Tax=Piscirickettsia salmonis TaxID=1238 RepID=A0AAC9EV65_PISSA|nr:IS3 family transposase [Piscirickettsia salmonis]ALB23493.1 integrase [Piscirickettsia salmonis]ALT18596.1 hypothetical protein PSLF89_07055 [Piscirickettsia salmonis LF-89 = ATCC VR-1361]ALY03368.1 hypothetical protein AWE47_11370 [Piscirickettsia salmonis]AMA42934.1 hypothetical protein AWJ11_11600 [Piscirickettsia salmonis]AOS35402.1 hypothetical protein AVM72_08725 [Piscirickettsia salmonis]
MLVSPELKITVARQCELLSIERSGLYYKPVPKVDDTVMMSRIYDIWYKSPCFGYRRVTKVLRREGMRVNRKKVKRLMDLMGLKAIFPGPKTLLKGEHHKIYDYLLDDLYIARPNHAWQVDITYIRTRKGFAYLTALIDVYSRYIVGWALSNTMEASFCLEALNQALEQGQPEIINSDQGRQFTGNGWISALKNRKIKVSMTGKGRCIDNVYIERFWRSIKHEKIKLFEFDDIHELEDLIAEYIHHYNHERPHQALGDFVPAEVFSGAKIIS